MTDWQEVKVFFYSARCDLNYNRRYVDGSNRCKFLPHFRSLEPLGREFVDRELGMLIFTAPRRGPVGVLINFAAHPLASHAPGLGSHQISADYPGELRRIMEENSCRCVFVDGAAGDQFPKDSECGWEAVRKCASGIAVEAIRGIADACRNRELYLLPEPKIRASIETVTLKLRRDRQDQRQEMPVYAGKRETEAELQFFAVGDVCLVGVPGEMLAEIGQEIKWHSPYRRTFILYNSTAYLSYLPHANAYALPRYEAEIARRHRVKFWTYVGGGGYYPFGNFERVDQPRINSRAFFWEPIAFDHIEGFLYWHIHMWRYNDHLRDSKDDLDWSRWNPTHGDNNGMGAFFYPGKNDTVYPSLRASAMRDGIEDVELFRLAPHIVTCHLHDNDGYSDAHRFAAKSRFGAPLLAQLASLLSTFWCERIL